MKLFVTLIFLPLVLLLGTGYLSFITQRNMLQKEKEQQTLLYAEQLSLNLSGIMQRQKQILEDFSRTPSVREMIRIMPDSNIKQDYLDLPQYEPYLKTAISFAEDEKVGLIYISSPDSFNALANFWIDLPEGYDARQRPWYIDAMNSGGFTITEPYVDQSTDEGNIILSASMPIVEASETIGVTALDMTLNNIITYLEEQSGTNHGGVYLVDRRSGVLIFGESLDPLSVKFLDFLEEAEVTDAIHLIETLDSSSKGIMQVRAESDNVFRDAIIGFSDVPLTPWSLVIAYPERELLKQIIGPVLRSALTSTLIIIGVLLIVFVVISRTIIHSISLTARNLQEISQGARDLTVRMKVKTKDEVGMLAGSFNNFVEKLRQIMINFKNSMLDIKEQQSDLVSHAEETASASGQINSNVGSINNEIGQLDGNIQEVSTAIEELRRTVENLQRNVETQSTAVSQSTASIEQMMAHLKSVAQTVNMKKDRSDTLSSKIHEGYQVVESTAKAIEEVVQQAGRITEISEVITSVASQTNLLSMNAAIEAAHAGESGKGFAVVADEIRKLAETSQKNSKEISITIKDILASLTTASEASSSNRDTFEIIRKETRETIDAFDEINSNTQELSEGSQQILDAITELNNIAEEVRNGSSEMLQSVDIVNDATVKVSQISASVKSGMHEISSGTGEIAESMTFVENTVQGITEKIQNMFSELEQFTT